MIQHFFWDFDGTLYDSYPIVTDAFVKGMKDLGIGDCFTWQEVFAMAKHSLHQAAVNCMEKTGISVETLMESYRRHQTEDRGFKAYDGMDECLRSLKNAGATHYLYTHRDHYAVERLAEDGLWPLFDDVVTGEDSFPMKPAPDALLAMVRRNGLHLSECAMVGDRDIDIEAAHNAGMAGILFDPGSFFPEQQAEYRFKSMNDLCGKMIQQL